MRIGLLDHMGYGNLGDAATQEVIIANIRERLPEAELIGFSLNPEDTMHRHGISCHSITYWHPGLKRENAAVGAKSYSAPRYALKAKAKKIPIASTAVRKLVHWIREVKHMVRSYRIICSLDVLIFSGGGQLGELWRGPWAHPWNVLRFALMAKLAGKQLIFLNVGAGPLRRPLSRLFIRRAVSLADYVSFRDIESQRLVESLGVKRPTLVFPDSAYLLEIPSNISSRVCRPRTVVGVNPIGFCDPRIWPRADASAYETYLDKLAEFCLWLVRSGYEVHTFSTEMSVDVHALEDLRRRLDRDLPAMEVAAIFEPTRGTVEELLIQMSEFDFIVTSKFHGVVFSHLLSKPVIALSYHPKIDDLMRAIGHHEYCIQIEHFETEALRSKFSSMIEDAARLRAMFSKARFLYAHALESQFDGIFSAEAMQSPHRTAPERGEPAVAAPHQ